MLRWESTRSLERVEIAEAVGTPGWGSLRREALLRARRAEIIAPLIQVTRDSLTLNPPFFTAPTLTDRAFGNG